MSEKNCLYCNELFTDNTKSKNKKYCCNDHWLMDKNSTNGQKDIDYIECPVCAQKVKEITILHVKKHGYESLSDFKQNYNIEHTKCQKVRNRMIGKNNPGYKHEGKLSPWSKNNPKNNSEILKNNFNKAESSRTNKRKNEIGYWTSRGVSEEQAKIEISKHQSYVNSHVKYSKASKISTKFFSEFENSLIFEYRILNQHKSFYVDSIDLEKKKIIEFYGDYWHGNPKKYSENNLIRGKLVKDKWKEDSDRVQYLISIGYDVKIVWEDDYKTNKKAVINDIIEWLK